MAMTTYGAIVISAADITLRIYEINKKNGIKQLDELVHVMHYGQEIYAEGLISFDSADEICRVLVGYQRKLQEYMVENVQLFLTHSLTDAINLDFLMTQIRIKTGLKAKVLNNSKERYLTLQSLAGSLSSFEDIIKTGTLILDVGYGNVQVTIYNHSELISSNNYRLGISRLRENIMGNDMKLTEYSKLLHESIKGDFDEYYHTFVKDLVIENFIVIGSEVKYLNRISHKNKVKLDDVKVMHENIFNDPEISEDRALLLSPLFVLIEGFASMTQAKSFYALDVDLSDGAAVDYATRKVKYNAGHSFEKDRISGAINLAKRYECAMSHNLYVLEIARELFNAVAKPFSLNSKDQQVLEIASIMYNCGRFINIANRDESSYMIIKDSDFVNLSDVNRLLVANVLRYKNIQFPYKKELNEPLLNSDLYVIMARITALFRLAEALDTCHLQKLSNVKASIKGEEFIVRATSKEDVVLETREFEKRSSLFQEVFGLKPVFKCKRRV